MCKYFLVDSENVHLNGLVGIKNLTKEDTVIIFLTTQCSKKERNKINEYKNTLECNILTMECDCGTKNALDFQLVSYLGLLIGEHRNEHSEYYIVSKDKGYISSINLLSNCCRKHHIKRVAAIDPKLSSEFEDTVLNELHKNFRKNETCIKLLNIMKLTNDISLALDMIERVFNNSIKDWRERVQDGLKIYYKESVIN